MSTNDYLKYVTQQFVTYMDQSKQERRNFKQKRKAEREPILLQMFGMIPLSLSILFGEWKKKIRKKDGSI